MGGNFCLLINDFGVLPELCNDGPPRDPSPRPGIPGFPSLGETKPDTDTPSPMKRGTGAVKDSRRERFPRSRGIGAGLCCTGMSSPDREGHSRNGSSIRRSTEGESDLAGP